VPTSLAQSYGNSLLAAAHDGAAPAARVKVSVLELVHDSVHLVLEGVRPARLLTGPTRPSLMP
jgi:hypothetical protein